MSNWPLLINAGRILLIVPAILLASCGGGSSSTGKGAATGGAATGGAAPTPGTCTSVKYAAPSGASNDIEFIFDKAYVCGQFANGDWWVSTGGGPLTIVTITPAASAGLNGYEVNPTLIDTQSFDLRIPFATPVAPSPLPTTWSGVSSVVKAVSIPDPTTVANKTFLRFAAVLTVLSAPLANSSEYFRPNYFGDSSTKKFYSVNDLRIADFLARSQYAPDAATLVQAGSFTIGDVATRYKQVQLDHIEEFYGDTIHPLDNMPDYGADIATNNSSSLLRMLLNDFSSSNSTHRQALINYLQWAVDLRAIAKGGRIWSPNGGHGQGRKLPLLFARYILNDADFSDAIASTSFSEDTGVYQGRTEPLWGRMRGDNTIPLTTTPNPATLDYAYWEPMVTTGGGFEVRDPYGYVDGGTDDIGGSYQFCCAAMPWKYTAMAVRMLNLAAEWRSNVGGADYFLLYVDRWTTVGSVAAPDPCTPYPFAKGSNDWTGYGITWGPDLATPGDCIKGGGPRWPGKHNINANDGNRKNNFSEALFNWCRPNGVCN